MPRWLRITINLAGLALLAAALARELRKPAEERTWHGQVLGMVPYDFRPPTLERVRQAFWSPDDPRILTPTVFGVGWTLNFGRLSRVVTLPARAD